MRCAALTRCGFAIDAAAMPSGVRWRRSTQVRTYRVSNVIEAQVLADSSVPDGPFDLGACWRQAARRIETRSDALSARVRVSARGRELLELLRPYVTAAAARTASKPDRRG